MHKRHKHDIIVILSLVGLGISLYLAITHYLGFTLPCDLTKGCEAVLNSKYSSFAGLPLSVWGVVFYTGVIILSLLSNHYHKAKLLLTIALSVGALGALALLAIQFFVLKKVCQYCLATDVLNIILFLWNLNVEHRHPSQENLS